MPNQTATRSTPQRLLLALVIVVAGFLAAPALAAAATFSLSSATYSVTEGTATVTITINKSGTDSGSVSYATSNGTATAGSDYTAASGSENFGTSTTTRTFTVPITNDTLDEDAETFTVTLSNASSGNSVGSPSSATVTIDDNDNPPTFSASDASYKEGSPSGNGPVTISAFLSAPSSKTVTVQYATADGTALASSDYTASSGTVTFAPGQTQQSIVVSFIRDTVVEPDETFAINFSNATNATIADSQQITTIRNDDDTHYFLSSSAYSGEEGTGITVTINRGGLLTAESVQYTTSNGTAQAGSDYTATSGSVSFAAGETSKSFTVPTTEDALVEGDETFSVIIYMLSSTQGSVTSPATATVTIQDDDFPPTNLAVSKTDSADPAAQGQPLTYTVTVQNTSAIAATNISVLDTLPAGFQYQSGGGNGFSCVNNMNGSITCTAASLAGNSSVVFPIVVVPQSSGNFVNNISVTSSTYEVFLTDNQSSQGTTVQAPGTFSFSAAAYAAAEGGTATITVQRSGGTGGTATVDYSAANGSAESGDYTASSGTLTFAPGETSKTFTIATTGDVVDEDDETVNLQLANTTGGASLGSPSSATLTIQDDDAAPTISIPDISNSEGTGGTLARGVFVYLSAVSERTITVQYQSNDGTAQAGSDYTAVSGTLTFAPGETYRGFIVYLVTDSTVEPDETFTVDLANPTNASIADSQGLFTILNDDSTLALSAVAYSGEEGTAVTLTVNRTGATQATTVNYSTQTGTASTADYAHTASGTVSFASGETSKTFTVATAEDALDEDNETFTVHLTSVTGPGNIGSPSQATVTIEDDDEPPTVSITDVAQVEGNSSTTGFVFTISLSAPSSKAISGSWATSAGTATAGSDYTSASGTFTIPVGSTSTTKDVQVAGDTTVESDETFFVDLSSLTNAAAAGNDPQGQGTIVNDDSTYSLSSSTYSGEEGTAVTLTINRAGATPSATVDYATSDGTAGSADYTGTSSGQVSFSAGATSKTFSIQTTEDTLDENDETLTVTISNPSNGNLVTPTSATVTIEDDDAPPALSVYSDFQSSETNSGTTGFTFGVVLSAPSAKTVSGTYATSDGTATAGSDYVAKSGSFSLPPGITEAQVTVQINGDTTVEPNETFFFTIDSVQNATVADGQTQATIFNDDSDYSFSSSTYSGEEGTAVTLTINRSGWTPSVSVPYQTANGSAESGDYAGTSSGSVFFPAGEASVAFTVQTNEDAVDEDNETFTVTLGQPVFAGGSGVPQGRLVSPSEVTVTIEDDDAPPTVSIDDVAKAEGNSGNTAFTFTITLSTASERTVSGSWAAAPGTAIGGVDYDSASGSFSIASGSLTDTVTVQVNGDTTAETDETFEVVLSALSNATLAGSDLVGLGTIQNDDLYDLKTTKTAPAGPVASGQDLAYSITVENLSQGVTAPNAVLTDVIAAGADFQSASAGCNYNSTTRTVTCALGNIAPSVVKNVTLTVRPNTTGTLSNTATASADGVDGALANNSATVVRTVEEPGTLIFSSATYAISEAGPAATITVNRAGGAGGTITVGYTTTPTTATAADYTDNDGTLTFAPGETTKTFAVQVTQDNIDEANETVALALAAPTGGAALGSPSNATLTIEDDDSEPTLSINDVSKAEGNSGTTAFTFTISLSAASGRDVAGTYATEAGSATEGLDYQAASGNFSISAGSTSTTVTVQVSGELLPETDETFLVKLTETTSAIAAGGNDLSGQGTIENDDFADLKLTKSTNSTDNPAASGANLIYSLKAENLSASAAEGATLVDTLPSGVTFVSAATGCSYNSTLHTVTCNLGTVAGNSEMTVSIVVTLTAAGAHVNNAIVTSTSAESSVANNTSQTTTNVQGPGTFLFAAATYAVSEGDSRSVTVLRQGGAGGAATVKYATSPATAEAADFTDNDGTLTFAPGETEKTFTVATSEDAVDEEAETVALQLSDATGASLGSPSAATLTIEDDDAAPSLAVADVVKDEGASGSSPLTFTIKLTGTSDRSITIDYATSDGTATAADYTSTSGTLTFAPGETEKTVAVSVSGDLSLETDETFTFKLSNTANATIADAEATGTIKNDDVARADLALEKTGPVEALIGGEFDFKLKLTNNGPETASTAGVQDILPSEVSFVSSSSTKGTCTGTDTVSCAIGTLAVGESAEITIRVKAVVVGNAKNNATAVANEIDPVTTNNAASTTTVIKPLPTTPPSEGPPPPVTPPLTKPCQITLTSDYIFRGLVTFIGVRVTRDGFPLSGIKVYSKHSWYQKITNTTTDRFGYTEYHFLTTTPGATVEFVADCDGKGLRPASLKNLRTYGPGRAASAQEPTDIVYGAGLKETSDLKKVTPFVLDGHTTPASKANCESIVVEGKNLRAGKRGSVTVKVLFSQQPVKSAAVVIEGVAGRQVKSTGLSGAVSFVVSPKRSGLITVRVPNFATCSPVESLAVSP